MQVDRLRRLQQSVLNLLGRFQITENGFLVILAVGIGVLAGFGNFAFRWIIDMIQLLVVKQGMQAFGIDTAVWSWSRLWTVLFPLTGGLLLIPFGVFCARDLKWGFSSFLERVNLGGAKVPGRTIFTRGLACAITLGTGGSAGQEGPIAQIGGAMGSSVGQWLRMSGDRLKILVACGVAGGVAATFNAPIAGVFFALEIVLLSAFELASFTPIVISSGIATVTSRLLMGNRTEFSVIRYSLTSPWELVCYALLGVVVGLLAALFIDVHFRIKDRFAALPLHRLVKPLVGGLLVGLIAVAFPQVMGNGYHEIQAMLDGHGIWWLLAALVLAKALATSITLGAGLPGGLFAPSLFLGAAIGGTFGQLLARLAPAVSPGAFALVGMGAFLSASTHAPMTAIFLLFELTASYQVIVPIMITCVIGTAIARSMKRDSLETVELTRAGIDLRAGQERHILKAIRVGAVMNRKPETVAEGMTLRQFTAFLPRAHTTSFPLLDVAGKLTGIISVQDVLGAAFEPDLMDLVVVKELATHAVISVIPGDNLDTAMRRIGFRNIEQLPVVDPRDATRLLGIVSRRDMIAAYNRALLGRALEEVHD